MSAGGLEALAYAADGTRRPRAVRLPADPFDGRVHEIALHQAVKVYLANQRQGTAQTKNRKVVTGGNQKPWRQKGTGRARQGSIRSPLWPGGGTTFGPQPRDYRLGIPKKLRRLALRSALNARARERALAVIEPLAFEEPKTRRMVELMEKMGLADRRVLVLTSESKPNLALSARNLGYVEVMRYSDASTYDVLRADAVVIEEPALGTLEPGSEVAAGAVLEGERVKAPARDRGKAEAAAEPAPRKRPAHKTAPAKKAAPKKAQAEGPKAKAKKAAPKAKAKKPAPKKPGKKG